MRKPPLKAASRCWRSAPATTGPARTNRAYAGPGSWLPLCNAYRTEPRKAATVTSEPSAVLIRDTVTRSGGAGAVALAVALRSARLPVAAGVTDGVAVAGEVQPARTHMPARRPAAGTRCFLEYRLLAGLAFTR